MAFNKLNQKFDERFDDIYCSPDFAKYVKNDGRPITKTDVMTRFAVSFLMGESIVVPDSLLIDHSQMLSLLQREDWCTFLFNQGLLKVAYFDNFRSWADAFKTYTGGNPERPPMGMSSNRQPCEEAKEAWIKGRYDEAQQIWVHGYPDRNELYTETLRRYCEIGGVNALPISLSSRVLYSDYLKDTLSHSGEYSAEKGAHQKFFSTHIAPDENRDSAWSKIKGLRNTDKLTQQQADDLTAITIRAKHRQFYEAISQTRDYSQTLASNSVHTIHQRTKQPAINLFDEVPLLDKALSGKLELDHFLALARDDKFIDLRNQFLESRSRGVPNIAYSSKADQLFKHAGDVIGEQVGAGRIKWVRTAASGPFIKQAFEQLKAGNIENAVLYSVGGGIVFFTVPGTIQWITNRSISSRLKKAVRSSRNDLV